MKKCINSLILLLTLFLIICLACNIKLYLDYQQLQEAKNVDYTIYPSSLPSNELLRVKEAEELYDLAFDGNTFFAVSSVNALIKLIQHAWQWDKNAMLYYDSIRSSAYLYNSNYKEEGMISFDEFMSKYRDKLVDRYGRQLEEPGIFKHPDFWTYFYRQMFALGYPYFVNKKGLSTGRAGYDDNGLAKNTTDEDLEKSIDYLTIGINNGYHRYETLIGRMLFQSGENFKYNLFRQHPQLKDPLNKLSEYRKNMTPERLKLAIDYAQIMAEHGSLLGMFRNSEAYFYGLGRERDEVKAYAWALIMDITYQEFVKTANNAELFDQHADVVMQYQAELKARLEQILTEKQKQASQHLLASIKETIVNLNYYKWRNQIDDFEPRP